jgi:hypothetical protein
MYVTQIKAAFPNLVFLDTDYASVALTVGAVVHGIFCSADEIV